MGLPVQQLPTTLVNSTAVHGREGVEAKAVDILKGVHIGEDKGRKGGVPPEDNLYGHVGVVWEVDEEEEQ